MRGYKWDIISPVMWVTTVYSYLLLISPLLTTHEPASSLRFSVIRLFFQVELTKCC